LAEAGFGELLGAAPEQCEWAERASHCWAWCGGWQPQSWPLYAALYPVPDWHLLTDLMQVIRKNV
jgi:hypothetical protein